MNQTEIYSKVTAVIVECLGLEPEEVKPESRFMNDLGSDSIMLAEIIMKIEDEFDLRITDEEVNSIRTVGDAVDYITSHQVAA